MKRHSENRDKTYISQNYIDSSFRCKISHEFMYTSTKYQKEFNPNDGKLTVKKLAASKMKELKDDVDHFAWQINYGVTPDCTNQSNTLLSLTSSSMYAIDELGEAVLILKEETGNRLKKIKKKNIEILEELACEVNTEIKNTYTHFSK